VGNFCTSERLIASEGLCPMQFVSTNWTDCGYNKEEVEDDCLSQMRKEYKEFALSLTLLSPEGNDGRYKVLRIRDI
jgi:hypothetical protein